jgi:uncharacterized heparinase superfamily protein
MDALYDKAPDRSALAGDGEQPSLLDGNSALPLSEAGLEPTAEPVSTIAEAELGEETPLPSDRALALSDIIAPRTKPGEALIRMAYRIGVPAHVLSSPFRKAPKTRMLGTVASPLAGDRMAGTALRAGHFAINGVKLPIAQVDFDPAARHSLGVDRALHSFSWLRDLGSSAPRNDCVPTAQRITKLWLDADYRPGKGSAWKVEFTGLRLLNWLVHAPLMIDHLDRQLKGRLLVQIEETARWLDRNVSHAQDRLGEVAGWCGITAAGLLLPEGRPRRLFGEAGLIRALGELVAEDGGVLSRCPSAQIDSLAMLIDLIACYEAVELTPPEAILTMRELLVPPLLTLRHGDGALGSWQGNGAIGPDRLSALLEASGVRARPLKNVQTWGFQRLRGGKTVVQFDAAPPPRARHARCGAASTLAFELSDGPSRVVVNCGGAMAAGGQVPARIGQGLRATAAHSTLVLDNANSTAVLLHGKLGRGAELVEVERRQLGKGGQDATRVEASHDGYAARFGLTHQRTLILRADGSELIGQDLLLPVSRKGKRGKIGFAIRFHLGRGVESHLSEDGRGASLLLPDGRHWQFRLRGDTQDAQLLREDSLWIDGEGRPHPTEQLVIEGMTSRGGGEFSWLLRKMG